MRTYFRVLSCVKVYSLLSNITYLAYRKLKKKINICKLNPQFGNRPTAINNKINFATLLLLASEVPYSEKKY